MSNTNVIKNQALVLSLKIRRWSGRKFDRRVTTEVNNNHNTSDAGRFNKILIDVDRIKGIAKVEAKIRDFLYTQTMKWGDGGDRLLASKNYFNFLSGMGTLKQEFEGVCNDFIRDYPLLVQQSQQDLKNLFNPLDYPTESELRDKFGIEFSLQPVPDDCSNIMISSVSEADMSDIRTKIQSETNSRISGAIDDMKGRISSAIDRYITNLEGGNRFHDTMVGSLETLAELIPNMNFTNDNLLSRLEMDLRTLAQYSANDLRNNPSIRNFGVELAKTIRMKLRASN